MLALQVVLNLQASSSFYQLLILARMSQQLNDRYNTISIPYIYDHIEEEHAMGNRTRTMCPPKCRFLLIFRICRVHRVTRAGKVNMSIQRAIMLESLQHRIHKSQTNRPWLHEIMFNITAISILPLKDSMLMIVFWYW